MGSRMGQEIRSHLKEALLFFQQDIQHFTYQVIKDEKNPRNYKKAPAGPEQQQKRNVSSMIFYLKLYPLLDDRQVTALGVNEKTGSSCTTRSRRTASHDVGD